MNQSEDRPRGFSRKLARKRDPLHRLPSAKIPARLRQGDDGEEDVTAPSRGAQGGSQYMNQSVFGMIAAAGSRTDFNARFDETSDSEDEEDEEEATQMVKAGGGERKAQARLSSDTASSASTLRSSNNHREEMPQKKLFQSLSRLSLKSKKESRLRSSQSPSPSSEGTSKSSASNPREAPMMSRLLTAEKEFQATGQEPDSSSEAIDGKSSVAGADTSPQTLLANRLMEIFGFESPEEIVAEYPCWLLQSVLLQGYLYITGKHICFYAYLAKRANTEAKAGYLAKRGRSNSKFKRYWFILKGDVLSYYISPSEQYWLQGNIDLRYGISASLSAEKSKDKECKDFTLTTDKREYHFRADSASSAHEWVKSLQKTIFRSHNDGDSVKISLPIDSIVDVEVSPVVELAETVKIRVIEEGDSYAVDEYFFSFFSHGQDAIEVLCSTIELSSGQPWSQARVPTPDVGDEATSPRARSPAISAISDTRANIRSRSTTPVREGVRATFTPFVVGDDGRMSPRRSGDFQRAANASSKSSVDLPRREYGRVSFDRGRRSGSTSRLDASRDKQGGRSPHDGPDDSTASYVHSIDDRETDSSNALNSPTTDAHMSASQILTRSDVFRTPALSRLDTVASASTDDVRRQSEGTTQSSSGQGPDTGRQGSQTPLEASMKVQRAKDITGQSSPGQAEAGVDRPPVRNGSTPTLQEIVKVGAYPLQRAGAWAGFLRNDLRSRSTRMSRLLATESMSYLEKVSGMWAGNRKHYGENEGVVPDDRDVDPEDEEANVGHGDRFRAHFALPPTEKLQATYFGYLLRVLPLYGKIYISNRKFCFRSLLPGTKTKLILPLKDIENVDKEKGFRFGYQGLVLVIRGHEELFFEFNNADHRDDCTITLLHNLESVRYMVESGLLAKQDEDDAEVAKAEHKALQEARKSSLHKQETIVPDTTETIYAPEEPPQIMFDDPRAGIIHFKPTASLRIICLTIGSRGDVQPYIALCKGLLAEGHKPTIATHAEFGDWVKKHGIDFQPIDGDPAELMRICVENGMFTYSFLREATAKFRGWIDELLSSAWKACQGADILIESPSAMAGIHIAEALKIPYFRAFTMPWTRTRAYPHAFAVPEHKIGGAYNYFTYVMFDAVFWKAIAAQVNRWRKKELGLQSTNLDKMQPNKVPFLYNFSPHVVVPPLDYSDWVRVTGFWFLDEAQNWSPPKELSDFIANARADGKKLVYIGFGSIVVTDPAALTRTVVKSVLKADVRCILSKGWSDRLNNPAANSVEEPLPQEILQIKSAPHDWLFTQIDAAVHHGGAGTTGASLRAGLPTVIKPFFGDQFFFGSRVEDLGVGICLKKVNVSVFSRALWEATHSERMIIKARMLGQKICQEDGVKTAIQAIYRDLEYAKSLVQARASSQNASNSASTDDETESIEESWTFIGDESDPELQKSIRDWDRGNIRRTPRISLDLAASRGRVAGVVEPVARKGSLRK